MRKSTLHISHDGFVMITDGVNKAPLGTIENGVLRTYKKGCEPFDINALHFMQDLRQLIREQLMPSMGNEKATSDGELK